MVLDATYGEPSQRTALRRLARRLGARLVLLVCRADDELLRERLAARAQGEQTASDARLELWPELRNAFVEPTEEADAVWLDTARPLDEVVDEALAGLRLAG